MWVFRGLRITFISVVLFLCLTPAHGQNLRIFHIDVDQGDATLIVAPNENTLLIDSGRNTHGNRIKALLDQLEIDHIDYFIGSHYHADHLGGIDELDADEEITVGQAYDRGDKQYLPSTTLETVFYQNYQATVGTDAEVLTRGETIPLDPEVQVACMASGGAVLGEEEAVHGHDENDMSIALLIGYGDFQYFTGGDMGVTTEGKISKC